MDIYKACKEWVKDFSLIPTSLIKKAYKNCPEELLLLSSKESEFDYPCGWGWMFKANDMTDERWIRENIEKVEECGFLVYESCECGILLGIDGLGYDFYKAHWIPLYKARGFEFDNEE